MTFPLFIVDGVLLSTFLVAWAEATAMSSYRWTWWRFLRAVSVPLAIGVFGHLMFAYNGFLAVLGLFLALPSHVLSWVVPPLSVLVLGGVVLFGVPLGVLKLVDFVTSQFDDDSRGDWQPSSSADAEPE